MTDRVAVAGRAALQRTCVGCGEAFDSEALLRLVALSDLEGLAGGGHAPRSTPVAAGPSSASGQVAVEDSAQQNSDVDTRSQRSLPVVVDLRQRLPGRGAWIRPRRECVSRALRKGRLNRALRLQARISEQALLTHLVEQLERRANGLLLAASRRRALALGMDAVQSSLAAGTPPVMVVAKDASERSARKVQGMLRSGQRCCRFGTRDSLGKLMGRGEVAVFALLEQGIAQEFATAADRMIALSEDR